MIRLNIQREKKKGHFTHTYVSQLLFRISIYSTVIIRT